MDKVTITSEHSEERLWVHVPAEQVDTIQNQRENSEVHIFHDGIWENVNINNKSDHSISYRGCNSISVVDEGEGEHISFGSATNLSSPQWDKAP